MNRATALRVTSLLAAFAALLTGVAPAIDDFSTEIDETITATITPSNYIIGTPAAATITLTSDDVNSAPALTLLSPTATSIGIPSGVGLIL